VLVDSRRAFARCVNHALEANGAPPRPEAELHPFLGPPLHATFARLAGAALADACVASYRARYRLHAAAESEVFDGIPAALGLRAAGAGAIVAIPAELPAALNG
jgi:phosphoglycolate phosphatase